jgi:hypothetical protein
MLADVPLNFVHDVSSVHFAGIHDLDLLSMLSRGDFSLGAQALVMYFKGLTRLSGALERGFKRLWLTGAYLPTMSRQGFKM